MGILDWLFGGSKEEAVPETPPITYSTGSGEISGQSPGSSTAVKRSGRGSTGVMPVSWRMRKGKSTPAPN